MKFFILSVFGKDRPGIVAGVSKALYELGLNIEDSSMTRLNGEFTIMLIVSSQEYITPDIILDKLQEVRERFGLFTFCRELEDAYEKLPESDEIYRIVVFGADKPGIVYHVSQLLSNMGLNICDLRTEKRGELYVMLIEVEAKEDISEEELKEELEKLREALGVDISFEKEEGGVL